MFRNYKYQNKNILVRIYVVYKNQINPLIIWQKIKVNYLLIPKNLNVSQYL